MTCRLLSALIVIAALGAGASPPEGIRVSGSVLTPDGNGLAEATVALLPLDDPLDAAKSGASADAAAVVRSRTNDEGRFELLAPHPGSWRVRVEAAGFVPLESRLRALLEPIELGRAELRHDTGLIVRIVDPNGAPVADASVAASTQGTRGGFARVQWEIPRRTGRTTADGSVRLPRAERESTTISAVAAEFPPATLESHRGTAATLKLRRGVQRVVELVSLAGDPQSGVRVALGSHTHPVGITDEKGRLQLALDPDRAVPLTLATPDGRRVATRVGPPDARDVIRVEVGNRLSSAGQLIDAASHRPIANGLVWDLRSTDAAVLTDRAGGFVVHGAAGRRLELAAGAPGYLPSDPFELQLLDDGRPGPTLALSPAAAIEGRVVDSAGKSVQGATVELEVRKNPGMIRIEIGRAATRPQALTDSEGRFRIASVDPDQRYTLNVEADGFARAREELGQLEPYRTHRGVRVVLTPGQTLIGRVVDENGGGVRQAIVTARMARPPGGLGMLQIVSGGAEPPQVEAVADDDGRFEVRGLPAGRFDLEIHRSGFAQRTLSAIEIEDASEPLDLGEIALSPGELLQGIVRNRASQALENVEVFVRESGPGMMTLMSGPLREEREPDAVTDPTGWFSLHDLSADEPYSLEFRRTGYVDGNLGGIRLPRVEPLEMVLDPASTVAGTVLDPGGEPIAGARVDLRRSQTLEMGGNVMRTIMVQDEVTDHEGRFAFEDQEPGTISVSASASGFQEARLDNLEIPEGEDLEGLELPLTEGAILEGRVLAPDGRPALGATVEPVGEGGEFGPRLGLDGVGADGNGYYRLEGLAPGEISVEARHPDYPRVVRDVVLREGRNALDLTFEGGREVAGRVSDGSGGPVPDAMVRLAPAGRAWGGPETRSGPDGSFSMPGVPDGEYRLWAQAEGFAPSDGRLTVTVAGEAVQGLEVALDPGGAIRGTVGGVEDARYADLTVSARAPRPGAFGQSPVDYEGRYRIDHLTPETYTVTARLSETGRQATGTVTLEPGMSETTLDLEFGRGVTLSGTALLGESPIAGATVFAEGGDVDRQGWSQTDHDGRFSIDGLEPGTYRVDLREFQSGLSYSRTIDLATSREIELELPTTHVAGQVMDAADRRPLSGVMVELSSTVQTGAHRLPAHTATTDLEGRFRISSVADGQWRLSASKKGYAAGSLPVTVGSAHSVDDLRVALDATEGLTLEVRLPTGAAPSEVQVAVLDAVGGPVVNGTFATGEGGSVRLASVPAGEWELLIAAAGAATSRIRVRAPGPKIAVPLEPASGLLVEVSALQGSPTLATLRLTDAAGRPFRALSWAARPRAEWPVSGGRVEIDSLPPGSWTVRVDTGDGRSWEGQATTTAGRTAVLVLD